MTDGTRPARESDDANGDERVDAHLDDVDVGTGCAEIWEYLAERREE